MIISDLYQTNITCSTYNTTIDSGDENTTIKVTVKLEDFNKSPVTTKNVDLTVDKGYFKNVTGTSTTNYSNTTTKSVSATTKSDGTISAVYVPSEWGLCTFSANNSKIQVFVSGFKEITPTGEQYCRVWINKASRIVKVKCARNITVSSSNKDKFIEYSSGQIISGEFYPETNVYASTSLPYCTLGFSTESGTVRVKSNAVISSATACGAYFIWSY